MLAAIKHPGAMWRTLDMPPTLEEISKIVCGNIEMVPNYHTKAIMYCNEEGKMHSLSPNFFITNENGKIIDCILGSVVMFGPNDGDGNESDLTVDLFNETVASLKDAYAKQNP
jgi:hypothetical protein